MQNPATELIVHTGLATKAPFFLFLLVPTGLLYESECVVLRLHHDPVANRVIFLQECLNVKLRDRIYIHFISPLQMIQMLGLHEKVQTHPLWFSSVRIHGVNQSCVKKSASSFSTEEINTASLWGKQQIITFQKCILSPKLIKKTLRNLITMSQIYSLNLNTSQTVGKLQNKLNEHK